MIVYILQFLAGLLGMLIRTSGKIDQQNKRTPENISIKEVISIYVRKDFAVLASSFLSIFFIQMIVNAIIHLDPNTGNILGVDLSHQGTFKVGMYVIIATLSFVSDYIWSWILGKSDSIFKRNNPLLKDETPDTPVSHD